MSRSRSSKGSSDSKTGHPQAVENAAGYLMTFRPGNSEMAVASLRESAGVKHVARISDFQGSAMVLSQADDSDLVVFDRLGVAVAPAVDPDQQDALKSMVSKENAAFDLEREPVFYALSEQSAIDRDSYIRGYRDAITHLSGKLLDFPSPMGLAHTQSGVPDSGSATWGLHATRVLESKYSGRGVRIAVLDTGIDRNHPDFRGRPLAVESFVANQDAQDGHGHGTHCVGTACGPRVSSGGRRYGIAHESEIFVGKVLSNEGYSLGRSTLAGIEWAISCGCHIISLSLGSLANVNDPYSPAFERAGSEALKRGALIIAAAGNDSRRKHGLISAVNSPANCPSIMAVSAVDRFFQVADFSNGFVKGGGRLDLAGPGVEVYSSAPDPAASPRPPSFRRWTDGFDELNGTSMATPHVSGIAALYREAEPQLSAELLRRRLIENAQALNLPDSDVGAGLVTAPNY